MDSDSFLTCLRGFFTRRIYWLFLAVGEVCLILRPAFSQELGAYKTIGVGNFPDVSIWMVWDGSAWNPATVKPGQSNDIYIDQTHTLTLVGDEAVKSVFINAETNAMQKLNLSGFQLEVYGSLNAFSGAAPGIPEGAWNSQNWIGNSFTSRLVFRGNSRTIIPSGAWSGFSTNSRYSVIFDPGDGVVLTIEEAFKALSFTVRSGTVFQKLDTSVIPADCPTFSFNNETMFGVGPFGEFIIEPGATFLTDCNSEILFRSVSTSALNFELQNGGTLILEGNAPRIEAANFQLNGKVVFRGGSIAKSYLSSSFADASNPVTVRDLELQSPYDLTLPPQLALLGNLEKSGSGNFITGNTELTLMGAGDQEILGFSLVVRDLTLNKSGGVFYPNSNLSIQRNLTLTQGSMDMGGNDLSINTGLTGSLNYSGGSWKNMGQLTYFGIPAVLTESNATFPFEDLGNGGLRKIQLLGNSPGGNLSITFTEYKGAEYNSGFDDTDGTEILYRLFSYFQFSGVTPSANPLELRISAHQLIVDDVDDLRIVGTGYAAPGTHLPGLDPVELWARRDLTFADLPGKNFTVGSFRTLSVLPVFWLGISSQFTDEGIWVKWEVVGEDQNALFEVYRNTPPLALEWEKIGETAPHDSANPTGEYRFLDKAADRYRDNYYRIRWVDFAGNATWSEVTAAPRRKDAPSGNLTIYPNPYFYGTLHVVLPEHLDWKASELIIQDARGKLVHRSGYLEADLAQIVQNIAPGVYFVGIISGQHSFAGKLIRK